MTKRDQAEPPSVPPPDAPSVALSPLLLRILEAVRISIARLLRVSDEGKPRIYAKVFESSEVADLNYWLEILFSIGIATLGLITNSPAVVIGAMLISPLMGPITANGLALALGDFYLGIRSLLSLTLSVLVSVITAAMITWALPFHTPTSEILARVQPTLLDLGIAILSGAAGAIVVCRGGAGGGVTALPGVAVAVALMPPLGVVGFGVGIGWDWSIVRGGGLLFLTNLVAIIFTSFVVFFIVRMDAPGVRQEINQWLYEHERGERLYAVVERTPLRALMGKVGTLPRRLLILLIFLVTVSFPLGRTLLQFAETARIRRMVLEEVNSFIPREAVVREDLDITPDGIRLRMIALLPGGFPAEKRTMLEDHIRLRSGRPTTVTVFDVATAEDVSALTGRFTRQAAQEHIVLSVEELQARLWARVRPAVDAAWPAASAPIAGFRVTLALDSTAVRIAIAYLARDGREFGDLGREAVRTALTERLGAGVELDLESIPSVARIVFARREAALSGQHRSQLDGIAATLARFPRLRVALVLRPAAEDQPDALVRTRGESIRKYLVEEKKVAADRIELRTDSAAEPDVTLQLFVAPQT